MPTLTEVAPEVFEKFVADMALALDLPVEEVRESYQTDADVFADDFGPWVAEQEAEHEAPQAEPIVTDEAPQAEPIVTDEVTQAEPIVTDEVTQELILEATKLARKSEQSRSKTNLEIAGFMVRAIEHDIASYCPGRENVDEFRESTIGRFSGPLSKASSQALTTRRLAEFLRIYYLRDMLTEDVKPMVERVNWESLRILARWSIHLPGEALFEKGSAYAEEWKIQAGCEGKLTELVKTLAKTPMNRANLVAALDKHESDLSGKTAKSDLNDKAAQILMLFKGISAKAEKLGLSKAELSDWIIRMDLVKVLPGDFNPATVAPSVASQIAAGMVAGSNTQAIRVMLKAFLAFEAESEARRRPATAVTPTLNDTDKPNNDPLANGSTRHVH